MKFIKDSEFIRGNCPMTKEDIRILAISKLELEESDILLDIGGGTGSVSIQGSKIAKEVIVIEKDPEALEVLYQNKEKFQADNLTVIEGEAIEVSDKIGQTLDAIFVGGSGGDMEEILRMYTNKLKMDGRIVLTFITIGNLYKAYNMLESLGYQLECSQVQVSKTRGKAMMLFAQNPIFILSGVKEQE